jgi:Telomere resolvase
LQWVESLTLDVRAEVIERFRDRIRNGAHVRLTTDDFAVLIDGFVETLHRAKSKRPIRALCEAEIKLLEEGYPKPSVSKYLSQYRKAIALAVENGDLVMTRATSHRYVHTQRVTGIREERLEHWSLTFLKYSRVDYESFDSRSLAPVGDGEDEATPTMKRAGKRKADEGDRDFLPADWLAVVDLQNDLNFGTQITQTSAPK